MSLSILADENIPGVEQYFGGLGTVVRMPGRSISSADLSAIDVLLVRSVTRVDASLLGCSQVRFVGTATSGVDHIDRDYLSSKNIAFSAAHGANANSVVEYVLAAIAAVEDTLERLLAGGRVGIVGYGAIGRALAARLDALGISRCVFDPWLDQSVIGGSELEEVLRCDVITLHPELTDDNPWPSYHLFGSTEQANLTASQLLINASRGGVVDNIALLSRLGQHNAPHCVLDVWEGEPVIDPDLLQRVTLGTAHIAGYSRDSKWQATGILRAALSALCGEQLQQPAENSSEQNEAVVPPGLSGAALVRHLVQSRYDIFLDDNLLRKAVSGQSHRAAGEQFDLLRKNYRDRRELLGTKIVCESLNAQDLPLVQGLGCELATPVAVR